MRDGTKGCDGELISWGIHWGWRGIEDLDGRESRGMGGVRGGPIRGILQAPAFVQQAPLAYETTSSR